MKTKYSRYSYDKESFDENTKFSCHSWIIKSISNIENIIEEVEKNKSYLNEKDLVGKYNALNFLLEIYLYHESNRFKDYPKNQNIKIDFSIIMSTLIDNECLIDIKDYEGLTFYDNLVKTNSVFVDENTLGILNKEIDLIFLLENEENKKYQNILLKKSLIMRKDKKVKSKI